MFKLFKDMKNIDKKFNKQVKINYLTKTYNSNKSQEEKNQRRKIHSYNNSIIKKSFENIKLLRKMFN